MTNFLLSGYGFDGGGPYWILDDLSTSPTVRKHFHILNKEITLRKSRDRFCVGGYNLELGDFETCPKKSKINGSYTVCLFCRDKSGFNPAFYNSDHISPKQEIYNQRPHIVYLANFGVGATKVGIAARTPERWFEQGARLATIIKHCKNAYDARKLEEETRDLLSIPEAINNKLKRKLVFNYDFAAGRKEIESLKERLAASTLGIEDNEVVCFEETYLPVQKMQSEVIDLTQNNFISGKFMGMIGDIAIFEEGGRQFMASLKSYIGYKVSIDKEIITNQYVRNAQQSLF